MQIDMHMFKQSVTFTAINGIQNKLPPRVS